VTIHANNAYNPATASILFPGRRVLVRIPYDPNDKWARGAGAVEGCIANSHQRCSRLA
jgi:hypothetical protein